MYPIISDLILRLELKLTKASVIDCFLTSLIFIILQNGREASNSQMVKFAPGLRVAGSSKQLRDHLVHQVTKKLLRLYVYITHSVLNVKEPRFFKCYRKNVRQPTKSYSVLMQITHTV